MSPIVKKHRGLEVLVIHPIKLGAEFAILGAVKFEGADQIPGNVVSLDGESRHVSGALGTPIDYPQDGSRYRVSVPVRKLSQRV